MTSFARMGDAMARRTRKSQRGAILLNVAIGLMVFIGVAAFVVDHGVLMVGRNQAQNAADAGALAGAVAMAFDPDGWTDRTPTGPARAAALQVATSNFVIGEAPDVEVDTDVVFTNQPAAMCPPGANGLTPCIRVDVYRNQVRQNPLPAIFGRAFGLIDQGVRATATARVAVANASDCLKPWAIPDKWLDNHDTTAPIDTTWTLDDTFETGQQQGQTWTPYDPPDVYTPPSGNSPGTGFTVAADLGLMVTLKAGGPQTSISPGVFFPVRLPVYGGISTGGDDYRYNIANCNGLAITIGTVLESENGNMVGPTAQGVSDLIALDPNAQWDPVTKSVINSCAQATPSCGTSSPRVVAIPVFDIALYESTKRQGLPQFKIVNILGFFLDQMQGNDVRGYLTETPGLTVGTTGTIDPQAAFLSTIQLIR
jgi:Flp pilus assembly protein TadG